MAYKTRLSLLFLLDSLIVLSSIYLSSYILYDTFTIRQETMFTSSIVLIISHHLLAFVFGLYNKSWEYASIGELLSIFNVVTVSIITALIAQFTAYDTVLIRAMAVTWMLHILLIGGSRFAWRVFRDYFLSSSKGKKRTLIIGAGAGGAMVARQLLSSKESELKPVAFLDDDYNKQKIQIHGLPIAGRMEHLQKVAKKKNIEHILIAIPSLEVGRLNDIVSECTETSIKTQIIPRIEDIMTGKVEVSQFRDVEVEDLLGRDPVELDINSISEYITGKTILITGAGGSIGSEICRQIATYEPEKLILLGHGENSIYQIHRYLSNRYQNRFEIIPIIADVQDRERIFDMVGKFKPDVIYHAAAHKHVPLMEGNQKEAVKNNIYGTKNVAEAADYHNVGTFVLVSTDKAVNPTNVMGATKRVAEMVIQNLSAKSQTKFCAVRFGNVLGSRGSVIPLFKEQIQNGGPVTVTHPEMTRYFMTIPEASQLVMQAGALARGGEVFVLDMGEPVKIVDLAKNLIRLSGHSLDDIPIEFTGIRPGEKMYEELLGEDEVSDKQVFPKIYIGKATHEAVGGINEQIQTLLDDESKLKERLLGTIQPAHEDIDELAKEGAS
ncbi:polysaccharide biosynthesis protein [Filobacillus milosensis]|uniref:Polysaccharide biosynthesis protein n=1 Tax=Filobacillus milosensis TaxID=94137 RepID=A0A4Y8IDV0_9BACI|nr:nucleoside-diphosphate sugar epimerase/dehydratase [Filobacillus milosensis]TFB14168.1 polysaccharide biosynthesis protein [Filobacillus milosensis]